MGRLKVWVVAALAACMACSDKRPAPAPVQPAIMESTIGSGTREIPADQPGLSQHLQLYLALQNLVHLADIEHNGLFIDFGTPARMKYTLGQWKTGWGKDGVEGDATYTAAASSSARVFFSLDDPSAFTLRMRLRPLAASTLEPVLNNEPLASVRLDKGAGFADYDVQVPPGKSHVGENQLVLHFGETPHAADEEPSPALIDSIRFIPVPKPAADGGASETANTKYEALPIYGALLQELPVGGVKRKAITVAAPTTLSYYLEVPKGAVLTLRLGSPDVNAKPAIASVRVTPEGGRTVELWRGPFLSQWEEQRVPLQEFAGKVVKLELLALGEGVAGFASPSIMVPAVPLEPPETTPKSVILLLIDTQRADRLHPFNPGTRVQTPALDALAAQGAVFEAAQSPENWTKPACASVLTGLYPASHGTKGGDARLSEKALMVSEVFKQAGFATGTFVANGFVSDRFGFDQGWDDYYNYIREKHRTVAAETVFRDAANWVEQHKDKRFFLYVQTIDPHVPYDPPEDFLKRYYPESYEGVIRPRQTAEQLSKAKSVPPKLTLEAADRAYLEALYDAEVSYHDAALGTFIERLKKLGLYDKTLFVITADHGEEFYDHNSFGHGHTVYQELIHVPLIARFPALIAPQRIRETVSTVDIAPTVLSAAGVPVPDVMEGIDRMPQLRGGAAQPLAAAFSDFLDDRHAVRAGRWKLILRGLTPTLFDLEADPREQVELDIQAHPVAMRYCRILLGQFLGARDRGDWLNADPPQRSVELKGEDTEVDEVTRAGLKALGYAN
jgi:choline-sulfatase